MNNSYNACSTMRVKAENERDDFRNAWKLRHTYNVTRLVSETNGLDTFFTYTKGGKLIPEFTQEIGGELFVIAFKDKACQVKAGIVLADGYKLRLAK